MSRRPYPVLLMLAMSLPGAVRALGLGDIRVGSGLNEPLSAQIDIVGATRDELAALTATVANREIFQRYGADRPSFLSSASFKVSMDAQGKPVLIVRSNEAFTDPVVTFLVDLRMGKSEVVREYSLLLDPPGYNASRSGAETALAAIAPAAAAPAAAAPRAAAPRAAASRAAASRAATTPSTATAATTVSAASNGSHRRMTAAGTLRGIAHHAGARSETQVQRMMIAIFRANPSAFDGNINRMHAHAVLTIPTPAEVAAIPTVDARREVRAHMTAWRLDGRPGTPHRTVAAPDAPALAAATLHAPQDSHPAIAPAATVAATRAAAPAPAAPVTVSTASPAATSVAAPAAASVAAPAVGAASTAADAALKSRVDSLEQALADVHQQLAAERTKIQTLKDSVSPPPQATQSAELVEAPIVSRAQAATITTAVDTRPAPASTGTGVLGALLVAFAAVAAGFVFLRRRSTNAPAPIDDTVVAVVDPPTEYQAAIPVPAARAVPVPASEAPKAPVRELESVSLPPFAPVHEEPETAAPAAPGAHLEDTAEHTGTVTSLDLDIDIEALERSYLDSLPSEPADTLSDTARLEQADFTDTSNIEATAVEPTVQHARSMDLDLDLDLDSPAATADTLEITGIEKQDLHTAIMDTRELDHPMTGAAPNNTVVDYDLLDLDATAQHVQMSGDSQDHPVASERRMNIVDVLRMAVERDPQRRDLRMKLLETYYTVASQNQRAFMEVVRKISRERDALTSEDWKKVMMMGREIAADDILFAGDAKDDLADYAA